MRGERKSLTTSSQQPISANNSAGSDERPKDTSEITKSDDKTVNAEAIQTSAPGGDAVPTKFIWNGRVDRKRTTSSSKKKTEGNELSHLIPGYTAPMRLEATSLKGITGASLAELRDRSARGDAAAYDPSVSILGKNDDAYDPAVSAKKAKTPSSIALQKRSGGVGKIPTSFSSSFRNAPRKGRDTTAGSGWFNMTPTPMSDQLKTDLNLIRNRNYIDPKKFYKSADSFDGKVLQIGTVIEGSAEYYSSRLVKRDRRQNLTEEIMADAGVSGYAKRKYGDLQRERAKPNRKLHKRGGKKR